MKQLKLRLKLFVKHITLQVIFIVIAILSVIFVLLYYYLVYSNDELVKYFPKETNAYISFKVDGQVVESKFFDKFNLPADMKIKIAQIISNDLNQSAGRNVAIGLIKENETYIPLVIFYLNKSINTNDEIFTIFNKNDYSSFKIENPVYKKNYLVITKSKNFSDKIHEVIKHQEKSLNKNLFLIFGRQTIADDRAIFYADAEIINYYLLALKDVIGVENTIDRPVLTSFEIDKDKIIAITEKYKQTKAVMVPNDKSYDFSFYTMSIAKIVNYSINSLNLTEKFTEFSKLTQSKAVTLLNENSEILVKYDHFADKKFITRVESIESEELLAKISNEFLKILTFAERKNKTILLPDQTTISAVVRNTQDVYMQGNSLVNLVKNDKYNFTLGEQNELQITKNILLSDINYTNITGCDVDEKAETIVVGRSYLQKIPLLGEIANFGVFSTYPQTYPQFMLCLN